MLKRSLHKDCFGIGVFLGVFKSVWVVCSKNMYSFPLFRNCEGAKFGDKHGLHDMLQWYIVLIWVARCIQNKYKEEKKKQDSIATFFVIKFWIFFSQGVVLVNEVIFEHTKKIQI
jgi:hypothetical protein